MKKHDSETWGEYEERRSRALRFEAEQVRRLGAHQQREAKEAAEAADRRQLEIEKQACEISPVIKQVLKDSLHISLVRNEMERRLYVSVHFDEDTIHEAWVSF